MKCHFRMILKIILKKEGVKLQAASHKQLDRIKFIVYRIIKDKL